MRYKIQLWKILVNILSTKDRIEVFVPLPDLHCYLCDSSIKSSSHLLFTCPVSIMCWLQSPWKIHIECYADLDIAEWFMILLELPSK